MELVELFLTKNVHSTNTFRITGRRRMRAICARSARDSAEDAIWKENLKDCNHRKKDNATCKKNPQSEPAS
jgi:hypothetical protein